MEFQGTVAELPLAELGALCKAGLWQSSSEWTAGCSTKVDSYKAEELGGNFVCRYEESTG